MIPIGLRYQFFFVELVHCKVESECSKYVNHSRLDSNMSSETHEANGYGHDDFDLLITLH